MQARLDDGAGAPRGEESVSLGNFARSTASTFSPRRASSMAVDAPATRVPMTITSYMRIRCATAAKSSLAGRLNHHGSSRV
jgi:hypothetical protein